MNTKEKLKMMCHERGMEFKDLAEKMGVSRASLSQMINREVVTVKTLRKIAAALGLTYEGLTVQLGNQIFSDSIKRQNKPEETCRDAKEVLDKCRVSITPFPFHIVEEYARKNNFTLLKDNGITSLIYMSKVKGFVLIFLLNFLRQLNCCEKRNCRGQECFYIFEIIIKNMQFQFINRILTFQMTNKSVYLCSVKRILIFQRNWMKFMLLQIT